MKKEKKESKKNSDLLSTASKKLGVNTKTFLTLLGIVVATGGTYGGYTIYKGTSNIDQAPVYMSEVLDGDTFILETGEKIRLSEVDAPEAGSCGGEEAKKSLEKLLRGSPLRLEKDIEGQDKYDRLIRYVTVMNDEPRKRNIFVNKYLIENGLAIYENGVDIRYQNELREAENLARSKVVGVWKNCPDIAEKRPSYITEKGLQPPNDKCIIKGNISPNGYGKVYILPGCPNYDRTTIQASKGEQYFCSEEEAKRAGYVKANNCK